MAGLTWLARLTGLASVGRRLARCGCGLSDQLWLRRKWRREEREADGDADGTRSVPATLRPDHLALFFAGIGDFAGAGAADFAEAAFAGAFGGGSGAASGSSARFSTASRL